MVFCRRFVLHTYACAVRTCKPCLGAPVVPPCCETNQVNEMAMQIASLSGGMTERAAVSQQQGQQQRQIPADHANGKKSSSSPAAQPQRFSRHSLPSSSASRAVTVAATPRSPSGRPATTAAAGSIVAGLGRVPKPLTGTLGLLPSQLMQHCPHVGLAGGPVSLVLIVIPPGRAVTTAFESCPSGPFTADSVLPSLPHPSTPCAPP